MKEHKKNNKHKQRNSASRCNYRNFFFFLLLFSFKQNCFALQTVVIGDNQTKKISISNNELSRIFVKGDRIQNVRGVEGVYILTNDALLGQVFIKPTFPYKNKPFNLFITTEQGRNYNLFVTPRNVSGQDIGLNPSTPSKQAILWEKNTDYSQALVNLIKAMIDDEAPVGYSAVYPNNKGKKARNKNIKQIKYDNLIITMHKQYVGKRLYGEVFWVQNKCKYPISLTETMFYQKGARAIALLNPVIPARGQTMLFRVISQDDND